MGFKLMLCNNYVHSVLLSRTCRKYTLLFDLVGSKKHESILPGLIMYHYTYIATFVDLITGYPLHVHA